jgi:hypothetical protein
VSVFNILLTIVLIISALLTGILILMHSGKGTGVSDMIASSMYNSAAGSAVWGAQSRPTDGYLRHYLWRYHFYYGVYLPPRYDLRLIMCSEGSMSTLRQ